MGFLFADLDDSRRVGGELISSRAVEDLEAASAESADGGNGREDDGFIQGHQSRSVRGYESNILFKTVDVSVLSEEGLIQNNVKKHKKERYEMGVGSRRRKRAGKSMEGTHTPQNSGAHHAESSSLPGRDFA